MLLQTVETNVVTLNSALSAQQWQVAMHLFTKKINGDVVTFNASITSLEKGNRWKDALMLLASSSLLRLRLDEFSSSAVMTSYAGAWMWQHASDLLQLMKNHLMESTLFSCNAFHSACERARFGWFWPNFLERRYRGCKKIPNLLGPCMLGGGVFLFTSKKNGCVKGDVKGLLVSRFFTTTFSSKLPFFFCGSSRGNGKAP